MLFNKFTFLKRGFVANIKFCNRNTNPCFMKGIIYFKTFIQLLQDCCGMCLNSNPKGISDIIG
jgi:hypothetical protein